MTKTKYSAIVTEVLQALKAQANPERAKLVAGYFKTGKGQYGEGDIFWGMSVPSVRKVAATFWKGMTLEDADQLLHHEVHEARQVALFMLTTLYQKTTDEKVKTAIYDFYLDHTDRINNWDLVDLSSATIVGDYILRHPSQQQCLKDLAKSKNLWERRIAMISTLALVKERQFALPLHQATALLSDKHDLLHKAVGWVLREIGKQDISVLKKFLNRHAATMPRTTLRYAIERFDEQTRKQYLAMKQRVQ